MSNAYEADTISIASTRESDFELFLEPNPAEEIIFVDKNGVPYERRYLTEIYTEKQLDLLIRALENSEIVIIDINEDITRLQSENLLHFYHSIAYEQREE